MNREHKSGAIGKLDDDPLPISVHTRVLGADIRVAQRDIHDAVHGDGRLPESPVQVRAVGSRARANGINKTLISAWARRNLFGGATPSDNK